MNFPELSRAVIVIGPNHWVNTLMVPVPSTLVTKGLDIFQLPIAPPGS
jgi:hypothetical protein